MDVKPGKKNWFIAADLGVLSPGASAHPPPRPRLLPEARSPVPSPFPCQVYSADGEFLFKFGSHGEGNGQFNAPTGVAVDSNGNIIVADWGNSRIQVRKARGWHQGEVSRWAPGTPSSNATHLPDLTAPSNLRSSLRCSTALAPSCPISTHLQSHCMARRAWH